LFTNWRRNTTYFITSQMISLLGSSLVQYAIFWHITLTTKSGIYATLAIICGFLPTFLLSPFAGVWADRYNRKHLIIIADASIALATLILAIIFATGYQPIWLFLVAMIVRAFGAAVQNPSVGALLPSIVPLDKLTRVNGINSSVQSAMFLISPMAAGALYGAVSMQSIFMIDVLTAVLAITVMLTKVRVPVFESKDKIRNNYAQEFTEGLKYIWSQKYLRNLFVFMSFFIFMAAPGSMLTPLQVVRNYGGEIWHLIAIEVGFSSGMIVGGLIISAWGGFRNRIRSMVLATVVLGISTLILGVPIPFFIFMGVMIICGLFLPLFNTTVVVLLQEKVGPDYLGRVFGVNTMIASSMMPMGMLIFGPLADIMPIEWLMLFSGVLIVLSAIALNRNKPLLAIGLKSQPDHGQ